MTYATRADLIKRVGAELLEQLTDRNGLGRIDDVALNMAIADADADIDAYLKGRYSVPLSPVPQVINNKACDLVVYHLYKHEPPEHIVKRYNDAMRFLQDVNAGKIDLGVDSPAATSSGFSVKTNSESGSNVDWDSY